jgi:hypothetical protein
MPESTATQFGRARDIGTAKRVSFGIKISTLLHLKIVFKDKKNLHMPVYMPRETLPNFLPAATTHFFILLFIYYQLFLF